MGEIQKCDSERKPEGPEKRESNEKIVMLGKYWNSCQ